MVKMRHFPYKLAVIFLITFHILDVSPQKANSLVIKKCPYGNSECLVKMYDALIKDLANGNEEYNIPQLDPIKIKEVALKTVPGGPMDVQCTIEDALFHGFANTTTKKFKGFSKDFDGEESEMQLYSPKYVLQGNYKVKGNFLGSPLDLTGYTNMILTNVNTRLRFVSRKLEKDGEIFSKVEKMRMSTKFDRMFVKANVSNPEYALLLDVALGYANSNWKDMFGAIKDSVYKEFGKIWQDIFNQITTNIAYKEFFIDE